MPVYLFSGSPLRQATERFGTKRARLLADIETIALFSLPLTTRFRRITVREGLLFHGANGWGECAPFWDYDPAESSTWLKAALEQATGDPADEAGTPPAVQQAVPAQQTTNSPTLAGASAEQISVKQPFTGQRRTVPVNVTIPVESPEAAARRAATAGCATAKVKVADPGVSLAEDAARVQAVAWALADSHGERARVRVDANAAWTLPQALEAAAVLMEAAAPVGGLEYLEQPCASVADMRELRSRLEGAVKVAADELIRRSSDPLEVVREGGADLVIVKVAPLGGAQAIRSLAAQLAPFGVPLVVSSAVDSSMGIASGVEVAASLPQLPYACGLDTGRLLAEDVVPEPLRSSGGFLDVEQARQMRTQDLDLRQEAPSLLAEKWWERLGAMLSQLTLAGEAK